MSDDDENEQYEVSAILKHKIENGLTSYFVRWKGFDETTDEWVLESHMSCPELMESYWEYYHREKKKKKSEPKIDRPVTMNKTRLKKPSAAPTPRRKIVPPDDSSSSSSFSPSRSPSPTPEPPKKGRKTPSVSPSPARKREKQGTPKKPEKKDVPQTKPRKVLIPPPLPTKGGKKKLDPRTPTKKSIEKSAASGEEDRHGPPSRVRNSLSQSRSSSKQGQSPRSAKKKVQKKSETRSKSSTPFDIEGMIEPDEQEKIHEEQIDNRSGLEKGFKIQRVIQITKRNGEVYGLVKYRNYNMIEWIAQSVLEKHDRNALIQCYEDREVYSWLRRL